MTRESSTVGGGAVSGGPVILDSGGEGAVRTSTTAPLKPDTLTARCWMCERSSA